MVQRGILLAGILMAAIMAESALAAEKKIMTRRYLGEIHRINTEERTAIIGAYRFSFGSFLTRDESQVKLLGGYTGSFGDLQPGMKVKVVYADYGSGLYVVSVEQLPYSVDLTTREARAEHLP